MVDSFSTDKLEIGISFSISRYLLYIHLSVEITGQILLTNSLFYMQFSLFQILYHFTTNEP